MHYVVTASQERPDLLSPPAQKASYAKAPSISASDALTRADMNC